MSRCERSCFGELEAVADEEGAIPVGFGGGKEGVDGAGVFPWSWAGRDGLGGVEGGW